MPDGFRMRSRARQQPTGGNTFHVEWVARLDDALERLDREGIATILLDLTLPDGQGLEAFDQVFEAAPDALILVLCAAGDEEIARQAVQRGAHDYLVKDHFDAHWLSRTLSYIISSKTPTTHCIIARRVSVQ